MFKVGTFYVDIQLKYVTINLIYASFSNTESQWQTIDAQIMLGLSNLYITAVLACMYFFGSINLGYKWNHS